MAQLETPPEESPSRNRLKAALRVYLEFQIWGVIIAIALTLVGIWLDEDWFPRADGRHHRLTEAITIAAMFGVGGVMSGAARFTGIGVSEGDP
jgi:hypothetical protein